MVKENDQLASLEPVETDAIMKNLKSTTANAEIATLQLAEILYKINNGGGTLGRLIQDTTIAENINQTIANLKSSSKGLDENMEAAKHNFLLKGYFKNKEKAADKRKRELEEKKNDEQEKKEHK